MSRSSIVDRFDLVLASESTKLLIGLHQLQSALVPDVSLLRFQLFSFYNMMQNLSGISAATQCFVCIWLSSIGTLNIQICQQFHQILLIAGDDLVKVGFERTDGWEVAIEWAELIAFPINLSRNELKPNISSICSRDQMNEINLLVIINDFEVERINKVVQGAAN